MFDENKAKGIMVAALSAAQEAAEKQDQQLGDENLRGLDCGFAWVYFKGNSKFARFMMKFHADMVSNGYPSGKTIWYSHLHNVPTQSVSVHEAAVKAFVEVWSAHNVDLGWSSRLD